MASVIFHEDKPSNKRKQWYAYMGGGSVDEEQTTMLQSLLIVAKDWERLQLTCAALWFLGGCSACRTPAWPREELITADLEPEAGSQGDVLDDNPADGEPEPERREVSNPKKNFLRGGEDLVGKIMRVPSPQNERGDPTPWQLGYWHNQPGGGFESTSERLEAKKTCKDLLWHWGLEVETARGARYLGAPE